MRPYYIYMAFLVLFNLLVIATPFIASPDSFLDETIHAVLSPACHQLAARSHCYYPEEGTIADCPEEYTRETTFETERGVAHKFPVCARDMPLYLAALASGVIVYFTKWRDARKPPSPLFFVLALIPIALDGGTQFIGLRESTNELRVLTGLIAGFAFSFYFVPMLNAFFLKEKLT